MGWIRFVVVALVGGAIVYLVGADQITQFARQWLSSQGAEGVAETALPSDMPVPGPDVAAPSEYLAVANGKSAATIISADLTLKAIAARGGLPFRPPGGYNVTQIEGAEPNGYRFRYFLAGYERTPLHVTCWRGRRITFTQNFDHTEDRYEREQIMAPQVYHPGVFLERLNRYSMPTTNPGGLRREPTSTMSLRFVASGVPCDDAHYCESLDSLANHRLSFRTIAEARQGRLFQPRLLHGVQVDLSYSRLRDFLRICELAA